MPRNYAEKASCCGPFVQKQRRLDDVKAKIQELLAIQKNGRPIDVALAHALAEERKLMNWIASHEHRKK